MRIAKGMETCRLEGKVKFIFVIKEVMDYRTNKAGSILVCFNGERQTLGTKAMAKSQMEKQIEIRLKDISKGTEEEIYRDKLVEIPPGRINQNPGGHSSGILTFPDRVQSERIPICTSILVTLSQVLKPSSTTKASRPSSSFLIFWGGNIFISDRYLYTMY